MGNSNAIQFSMGFDLSQLQTGAARAQAMTARVMGRIGASSSLAMGAAAAATISVFKKIEETVKLAAEKVSGVFDMGREFTKLSERTGIATGRLSMMQRGLKMSDVEVEKLAPALTRMQVMLGAAANGSKLASGALSNLGLTVEDLKKLSPDQQFLTIAKAIAAIEDPSARATAAAGMFGRLMGGELMPLFRNAAALDMMGGKLDAQAEVFQKNAESFDKAAKKLDRVGKQFNGFWVGLSSSVVGSVLKALDQMQGGNFVEKGQQLGNVLSPVILAFMKIPAVIDFVEAGLATIAVYGLLLGESLMNGAERFYDGLKAAFLYALAYSTDLIASLLDLPAKLCIGLASGLEWAFQNAIAFFGNAMWDMIANVQAGFQFAIQTAVSKALSRIFRRIPSPRYSPTRRKATREKKRRPRILRRSPLATKSACGMPLPFSPKWSPRSARLPTLFSRMPPRRGDRPPGTRPTHSWSRPS